MTDTFDMEALQSRFKQLGLQNRQSQQQMCEAAHAAFTSQTITCIEAPTGTGKTLSYSIAALKAKKPKQHIVISTATIALQEQLIQKDIPLLGKILGKKISSAIAKGRRRYVCHARVFQNELQSDLLAQQRHTIDKLQQALKKKSWNGDRETLQFTVTNDDWQQVSTDAAGCNSRHCAFFEECAFYKARKKMHQAEVIITNHSLLLSDLELGGGTILPDMENCLYIIDECHHLPEKALHHFAKSASLMGSIDWINQLTKSLHRGQQSGELDEQLPERLKPLTHQLVQQIKLIDDFLSEQADEFEEGQWLLLKENTSINIMAEQLATLSQKLATECQSITDDLEQKIKRYEKTQKERAESISRLLTQFNFVLSRAQNLELTWRLFTHQRGPKEAPIARWFTQDKSHTCHASPINISQLLIDLFWSQITCGAVLCSATIRALGSFHHFYRRTGLHTLDQVSSLAIDPFFDYSQSVLYVPKMKHAPQGYDIAKHQEEVNTLLPQLILPNSGTLVLFTSIRAMENTYDALTDDIADEVLMQTQHSKSKIIDWHKDRIRCGNRSILFGLASFGEGLDLPADFCEHVIIHKLPFSVPTTPIELTRNAWLKDNNKNAFMLSTLPDASIKLTQFAGRLLRQESDIGIITILDNRLYAKNYGKQLLSNLSLYQHVINKPIDALKSTETIQHLFANQSASLCE